MLKTLLVPASTVLIAIGLAAPADAGPVQKHPSVQQFFTDVQTAGIVGVQPAILENGYNVCWQLWNGHYTAVQAAAALQRNYPTLTSSQAARFVIAAYHNLCPVPGPYDWWAYSTS